MTKVTLNVKKQDEFWWPWHAWVGSILSDEGHSSFSIAFSRAAAERKAIRGYKKHLKQKQVRDNAERYVTEIEV